MCGFSIVLILKGITLKSISLRIFLNKNKNFNKNETKSKIQNPTQFYGDEPYASIHKRIFFNWDLLHARLNSH